MQRFVRISLVLVFSFVFSYRLFANMSKPEFLTVPNIVTVPLEKPPELSVKDFLDRIHSVVKLEIGNGWGSGFYIEHKGKVYILTAGHVCDKSPSITIHTDEGNIGQATVVLESKVPDLCVLKPSFERVPIPLTTLRRDVCGIYTMHIGYPGPTGIKHQANGYTCSGIQFVQAIPGDSGGPVLDRYGNLIGVVVEHWENYGPTFTRFVDIDYIKEFLDKLP
jgi:S1-C subfamily serine protease